MVNDPISDMLTRIRNGNLIRRDAVSIPLTGQNLQICQIFEREGFIISFKRDLPQEVVVQLKYNGRTKKPAITNLMRISKPGLRIYSSHDEIPQMLDGMALFVLSTSRGIMTDREAKFYGIGGEVLCSIW